MALHPDLAGISTEDLLDGLRDALSPLHEGPGTDDDAPVAGCPGCEAQRIVDEIASRVRLRELTV